MCTRPVCIGSCVFLTVLGIGLAGTGPVLAQEVLQVYGSEGPAPAIQQAAGTFGDTHDVKVDVVTGPPDKWLDQAAGKADVVFASAEFMMADFVRAKDLAIDEASITPLYMRPSAVLVRPSNPKHISDFPDLLKPGVRVMVVTGSCGSRKCHPVIPASRTRSNRIIREREGQKHVPVRKMLGAVSWRSAWCESALKRTPKLRQGLLRVHFWRGWGRFPLTLSS